jgi:hypothetical protein
MTGTGDLISEKIKEAVKRYEEEKKTDVKAHMEILHNLKGFELSQGPLPIDAETRRKFQSLFQTELEI